MVSRIKTTSLVFTAGSLGIGISIMATLLGKERDKSVNRLGCLKSADEFIRSQPTVTDLLGNDFELGKAKLNDGWSKHLENDVRLMLPVKGEKDNGSLLVYARREDPKGSYKLWKIEMTFNKIKNKKLVLMDKDNGIQPTAIENQKSSQDDKSQTGKLMKENKLIMQ